MAHIDELISQQYWKPTTHSGEHEYFMQPQNPDLHDILKTLIQSEGYTANFRGYDYQYWNHGGFRYWIFDKSKSGNASINRAKEDAPRDMKSIYKE